MCNYKDFQPKESHRQRENIEWTRYYAYNATDLKSPRILLIGDSICNNYHGSVRNLLADCANISYWASSRCVTDPDYFRELDFYLDAAPYQLICFNNGLHCLTTDRAEWQEAYDAAIRFIQAKLPQTLLSVTLSTAMGDGRNEIVKQINALTTQIAEKYQLPLIDLYTPTQAMDKTTCMSDAFHYTLPAIEVQAEVIATHIRSRLGLDAGDIRQAGTETGPDGKVM